HITVDDFGTGYSSLNYLKRFPIDTLKLDKSFVNGLPHDQDDVAISRAVIALGHSLKMTVVAEGVETEEQRAFLRSEGCDVIQGYVVSGAIPADAITVMIRQAVPSVASQETASVLRLPVPPREPAGMAAGRSRRHG
ncbi:MAG TPA: EAL domain-containing protein, partial [Quisquiliibacterium sp.]|nr:EAL domain-containing protein [Quisquiliibacterium sp.]